MRIVVKARKQTSNRRHQGDKEPTHTTIAPHTTDARSSSHPRAETPILRFLDPRISCYQQRPTTTTTTTVTIIKTTTTATTATTTTTRQAGPGGAR
jgi:hypothetical protein